MVVLRSPAGSRRPSQESISKFVGGVAGRVSALWSLISVTMSYITAVRSSRPEPIGVNVRSMDDGPCLRDLCSASIPTLLHVAVTLALAPSGVKADPSFSAGTLAATSAFSIADFCSTPKSNAGHVITGVAQAATAAVAAVASTSAVCSSVPAALSGTATGKTALSSDLRPCFWTDLCWKIPV
jgi:hypothetical protein